MECLQSVAIAADGLKVRVLERRAARGDLDNVVHVELAGPSPTVADLAGVPVPQ